MKYAFHPEAEAELNHAVDYYNARQPQLGRDFAREIDSAIENIVAYPVAEQ
jgi:plasmid stabilization system protein ParE